ncbi:MAG TPA: AMP-binding protein [Rhodospirillaceae bacterium]|nr:AMP-binding protein [Rhodospirillaceae bacterium]
MANRSLRRLVDQRAAGSPDALFLLDPETGRHLTFAGLRRYCLALAVKLSRYSLAPGERVALLAPNGLEAAAMFVGLMAAGQVAVPLSLLSQPRQVAHLLDHADCRLVLAAETQMAHLEAALTQLPRSVTVVNISSVTEEGDDIWPNASPAGDDDALLMYTSGTTGRPKGVRLSHANLLAGARFVSEAHALGPDDRVLAVLPLYHVNAQVVTVLAPLFQGGSLVMPSSFSVGRFWSLAAGHGCTWLNLVPTMIAYLLNGEDPSVDLSGLRFCRSASAPLAPEHHRAFEARFGIGIIETMGLTETAAPVFSNPLDPSRRKIGSPGLPFGNRARVVDQVSARPLPFGCTGEIQIRGPNVMRGYHKNVEATAAAFTPDGWLRTGDLGHRDRDGFYFVTGRLKELIIKGGENIAPREIDEALLKHPALLEAATVGIPDPLYGQEIAAGVVVKPGMTVSEGELRAFCETELGGFKTPRIIEFLADLPKGPSGKVQRLRLFEGRQPADIQLRSEP